LKKIGKGNFGEVYSGFWANRLVALKSILDATLEKELMKEINILAKLKHVNIVVFLAIQTIENVKYIIMEYCNAGDLKNILIDSVFESKTPKLSEKIKIMMQISSGMAFLHENGVLHRDLATRNVLVSMELGKQPQIKISDFGLSREVNDDYYRIENTRNIPIKWTAPEVFKYHKFYRESDVWSFGITCWEIMADGTVPYGTMQNEEVMSYVLSGKIIEQIPAIPDELYAILYLTYNSNLKARPNFATLHELLSNYYNIMVLNDTNGVTFSETVEYALKLKSKKDVN